MLFQWYDDSLEGTHCCLVAAQHGGEAEGSPVGAQTPDSDILFDTWSFSPRGRRPYTILPYARNQFESTNNDPRGGIHVRRTRAYQQGTPRFVMVACSHGAGNGCILPIVLSVSACFPESPFAVASPDSNAMIVSFFCLCGRGNTAPTAH
jgi:hypothetical protein